MVFKAIILSWTAICAWVLYIAISDYGANTMLVFYQLLIWGAGIVPVALIGLLFKKKAG